MQHNKTLILNIQKLFYTINGSIRCTFNPKYSFPSTAAASVARMEASRYSYKHLKLRRIQQLELYTETCAKIPFYIHSNFLPNTNDSITCNDCETFLALRTEVLWYALAVVVIAQSNFISIVRIFHIVCCHFYSVTHPRTVPLTLPVYTIQFCIHNYCYVTVLHIVVLQFMYLHFSGWERGRERMCKSFDNFCTSPLVFILFTVHKNSL